jgi:ribonuclease P protein component
VSGTLARLKRRADFLAVAAARRKWVAPGAIVQARKRETGATTGSRPVAAAARKKTRANIKPGARVGFTVSRKVGSAVARNRARRRLKAALARLGKGCLARDVDVVVIGRTETLKRPFVDLVADLAQAFKRLDVWQDGKRT